MTKLYIIFIFIFISSIFGEDKVKPENSSKFHSLDELMTISPPLGLRPVANPTDVIDEIWEEEYPDGWFKWIGEQFIIIDNFMMKQLFPEVDPKGINKARKKIVKKRTRELTKLHRKIHDNDNEITQFEKWKHFVKKVLSATPEERKKLNLSEYHTQVLIRLKYSKEKTDYIYQNYLEEFLTPVSPWNYYYAYTDAIEEFKKEDYEDAADYLDDALLYSTGDYKTRVKALHFLIVCYQRLNWKYSEYLTWERLLSNYPYFTDYYEGVQREFKCGRAYKEGYREPAFATSWLSWLTGNDKTTEIHESVIKRAPYAKETAYAKILLAKRYVDNGDVSVAQTILQDVITEFPNSRAEQEAYLLLGNILLQLSEKGDGDGVNGRKALRVLQAFKTKYPKHKEMPWVDDAIKQILDHLGKHLYEIAYFYYHREKEVGTTLYAQKIIDEYPDSRYCQLAKNLLGFVNKSDFINYDKEYVQKYAYIPVEEKEDYITHQIPVRKQEKLDIPNDGKWLIPPTNLNISEEDTLNNYQKYIIPKSEIGDKNE